MDSLLGGEPKGCIRNCFESCCCICCIVAQSTEALDAATGVELGLCSMTERYPAPQRLLVVGYDQMPDTEYAQLVPAMTDQAV